MTNRLRCVQRTAALIASAALTVSTVAPLSRAQGEYVRELPPDYVEPAGGPPTPTCVNRLRSLGSPVEFSVLETHGDGHVEQFASGRLFRAGPAQPYSNLAAGGRSVTVYLDGFVCLEETRSHSITAFRAQCRGDELVGADGKDVWVLSFRSASTRSN